MDTKEALMLSRTPHIVKLMIEDLKDDEDAQRLEGHLDVVQGIILELAKERDAQAAELTRLRAAQPAVPDDVARDAERYRWLRDFNNAGELSVGELTEFRDEGWERVTWLYDEELDAGIDAAMLSASQRKEE